MAARSACKQFQLLLYNRLEKGTEVETSDWEDKQAAYDAIEHAQERYEAQLSH